MSQEVQVVDAVVVGAGPAGLALAYELSVRGVDVLCVSPTLAVWKPVYGMFLDEVASLDVPFDRVWSEALVSFPDRSPHRLRRSYGRVDRPALFERWSERLIACGQWRAGVVASALFSGDFDEIRLTDRSVIRANQLFDASGHAAKLVRRNPLGHGYQCAFGVDTGVEDTRFNSKTMGLMLWDNGAYLAGSTHRIATFDYVMPLSDQTRFVERTVLATRQIINPDAIASSYKNDLGHQCGDAAGVERCVIPLGHRIPDLSQRRIGFGGAASMVHPATGYMVARVLRAAPRVADAFVAGRAESPQHRAHLLWRTIWPEEQVRTHALYRFGLEVLLRLTPEQTWDFFDAFFELPDALWRPYLAGTATVDEITQLMWGVFRLLPRNLKRILVATTVSTHGWTLLDGLRTR